MSQVTHSHSSPRQTHTLHTTTMTATTAYYPLLNNSQHIHHVADDAPNVYLYHWCIYSARTGGNYTDYCQSIQYSPQSTCSYLITQFDLSSVLYVHIRLLKLTLSAAYKYELVADITPAAYASLSTEYWTISSSKLMTISECLPVRLRCICWCWWSPNDASRFG